MNSNFNLSTNPNAFACCRLCKERHLYCHSTCEAYKQACDKYKESKEDKSGEYDFIEYQDYMYKRLTGKWRVTKKTRRI